jgi:membrane associated rhomboid family serine protease
MRDDEPSWGGPPAWRWRWSATTVLMAVITGVFLLQWAAGLYVDHNLDSLEHHPDAAQVQFVTDKLLPLSAEGLRHGYVWQLVTFQFLHANFLHLACNLFCLWMFGRVMEQALGRASFLKLYFLSGIAGGLLQALLGLMMPERFGAPVVGASAGIIGLFGAFAMFQPDAKVLLWFIIPMSARLLFWGSVAIAVFFLVEPMGTQIANGAHLGGLLMGAAYVHWRLYTKSFRTWLPARAVHPRQLVRTYSFKQDYSPHPGAAPEETTPDEFISREVDPILDKISSQGIQSLTDRERKILDAARKKMDRR